MDDGLDWLGPRGRDGGIDSIPLPVPVGGLSLCGKHAVGDDVSAALARCGATTVICLVERHEIVDRYPHYVEWLQREAGRRAVWFPIHDLHAPALDDAAALVDLIVARVHRGEHLLMHCAAGIGRAGTIAACVLIALGMDPASALTHVAQHRPMAGPEVGPQRLLVDAYGAQFG